MKGLLTQEQKQFIADNRLLMSGAAMAEMFGIWKSVVNVYMRKNGLTAPKHLIYKWRAEKLINLFTQQEDDYIRKNIATKNINQIAKELRRGSVGVNKRARTIGLGDIIDKKKLATQFKKGIIPKNKGKKMPPDVYEKCKSSMFKKGNIPHNANPIGSEVLRKSKNGNQYWMIKIAGERELKSKHVYLWKRKHGKVPKGYNVVFKDGNTLNCVIENLECISDLELLYRNSFNRYPREVIPTLLLVNDLKKKIKEKTKY
jgi:hypothetical protein